MDNTIQEKVKEKLALPEEESKFQRHLDLKFLEHKGNYSTIRKIFAPIWIKGPIKKFVDNKTVIVGDAAGQAKPTTSGGILHKWYGRSTGREEQYSEFLKTDNEISDLG